MSKEIRVFKVSELLKGSGEYILGAEQTGSHGCYLIYGVMGPGEKGRLLKPGRGHEEIVFAVRGEFGISGEYTGRLREGEAIHLRGEETCLMDNLGPSEAVYIIAGGHSEGGHH